jgi:spore coat-associated protein N
VGPRIKFWRNAYVKLSNIKARVVLAVGTAGALSALAAVVIPGTFGSFNASTSNPGNTVAAGTLQMTNSKSGAAIVTMSNIRPGDSQAGTLTITNSGSLSADMYLSESNVSGAAFASDLQLKVDDTTLGSTVYNGSFSGMASTVSGSAAGIHLAPTSGTQWASGESHNLKFTVTFPNNTSSTGADNAFQGANASAQFDWQGVS